MDRARYAFRVEWLDTAASLRREFVLIYFERRDGKDEVEMVRPAANGSAAQGGNPALACLLRLRARVAAGRGAGIVPLRLARACHSLPSPARALPWRLHECSLTSRTAARS